VKFIASLSNWLVENSDCVTRFCLPTIRVLKLDEPKSKDYRHRGYWSCSRLRALLPLRQTQENTTKSTVERMREQTKSIKLFEYGMQFSERIVLITSAIAPAALYVTNIYIFVAIMIALIQVAMILCNSGILRYKFARRVTKFVKFIASLSNWLVENSDCVTRFCLPTIRVLKLDEPKSKDYRHRGYWSCSRLRARDDLLHVRCLYNPARVLAW